ncbi:MAG: GGDEF domain-containing protein [Desulfovibrionaceae bacterium]
MSDDNTRNPRLKEVCTLLEQCGAGDDPDWLSLLLFVRNLVQHLTVFTPKQKADIQTTVLLLFRDKDLSPRRFQQAVEHLDALILRNVGTQEMEEKLNAEKRASVALLDEMNAIFEGLHGSSLRQQESLDRFGARTVEVVQSENAKTEIVKRVRSLVTELVAEVKEEAREWEERAHNLERTANYDPLLTELRNRRSLDAFLSEIVVTSQSRKKPLSMMMIDVDHFKSVNDTYGHQVGDDVLRALAKIVGEHALAMDGFAARYGGEELVLVCPGMPMDQCALRAEGIRRDVEEYEFQSRQGGRILGDPIHFTVSIGVSQLEPGWRDEELVAAADKALYRAKNSGRNIVARFEGEGNGGRVAWSV